MDTRTTVVVIAPHTSNGDFVAGAAAKLALGLRVTWIGKESLVRWPLGSLLRRLGGVPVKRETANAVVARVVE